MTKERERVTIIGTGPAGLTAAIYAARAGLSPLLISGPTPGGQLTQTTSIENFPGFVDGIMGTKLMHDMEQQAMRFGARFRSARVTRVGQQYGRLFIEIDDGELVESDALIVATGAIPRRLGLPNERELTGYGVSTCATCDGSFYRNESVVVVGGGDSAVEEVSYLSGIAKEVVLVHRREELRASFAMRQRLHHLPNVRVLLNSVVSRIEGSPATGLTGVVVEDVVTKGREALPVRALFVAVGHIPSTKLLEGLVRLDDDGYVETEPRSTATSLPGVFAAGDVQDRTFRQAVTAAGSGAMAAIEAERWLQSRVGHTQTFAVTPLEMKASVTV